jgi:hypothetical protein
MIQIEKEKRKSGTKTPVRKGFMPTVHHETPRVKIERKMRKTANQYPGAKMDPRATPPKNPKMPVRIYFVIFTLVYQM